MNPPLFPAFVNGRIFEPGAPAVSPEDQGLTLGLSVFDTALYCDGVFYFIDEHIERLRAGCRQLGVSWPLPWDPEAAMRQVAQYAPAEGMAVRVTVTRGAVGAGPTLVVTGRRLSVPPDPGVVVAIAERPKLGGDALEGIKSTNRLRNILAREEAVLAGAWEALLPTEEGDLCEGTIANLFIAKDDCIVTPGLERGCLPGIMREVVLAELRERPLHTPAGSQVRAVEARISPADLQRADEVFLTNTTGRVIPVVQVLGDPRRLPGSEGYLTGALRERIRTHEERYRTAALERS